METASLQAFEFRKYIQDDTDLLMDKVRMIYGEESSDDLRRPYKESCSRSPAKYYTRNKVASPLRS